MVAPRPPFFSTHRAQAVMLQEREGQHREQRMVMQAQPAAPFEVIEAEFFLQLLMGLLAHPPGLDRRCERTQRGAGGVIRQVILAFAVRAPFADQSREIARQMLALRRLDAIGHAHAHGSELRAQRPARVPVRQLTDC